MDSDPSTPGEYSSSDRQSLSSNSTPPTTPSPELLASHLSELNFGSAAEYTPSTGPVRNICCVGAGYVGGPTAAVIAFQNPDIRVTVVDKDAARIRRWNSQHLPIHEPGLGDIVRVARDGTNAVDIPSISGFNDDGARICLPARTPNLFFSTNVAQCISEADMIFLSVNTNTKLTGIGAGAATNMVAVEGATRDIALAAKPGAIVVEKSTVPCRTAQMIRDLLQVYRPGVPFQILSNPEFLAEGTAIKDLLSPDRILIGSAQTSSGLAAAAALKNVYRSWVDPARIVTVNLWSSELSKLVANAMLAQRISSINTISAVCERTGADIAEVAHSIGLDPRLGPKFLNAGLGFGGSCFKKDILSLTYLAETLDLPEVAEYWMQVLRINEFQRTRFVQRVVRCLNGTLVGKKIALLGYAFKKDTSDTRESPAVEVIKAILADSPAEVAIFDPRCNPEDVKDELHRLLAASNTGLEVLKPGGPIAVYRDVYSACSDASAVLILTEWDQFRYPTQQQKKQQSAFHKFGGAAPLYSGKQSEVDILNLREYIRSCQPSVLATTDLLTDPLGRSLPQPGCPSSCRDCLRGPDDEEAATEAVVWPRICNTMRQPKWVFDGRGLVDAREMEKLGFRVEGIGKAGSRSLLHEC